ncbi:hypothetical protein BX283_3831 [Streptomyces sp. TLI_146]|nr:hypothetical protein BX283_3831 [Streptomyces sp. TLI_146]
MRLPEFRDSVIPPSPGSGHSLPCGRIPNTGEFVADKEISPEPIRYGVDRAASRTAGSGSAARLAAISSARRVKEATALTK